MFMHNVSFLKNYIRVLECVNHFNLRKKNYNKLWVRYKYTINNKSSEKHLKWKTTEESFCEYVLTPQEKEQQKQFHFCIISNNQINIDKDIIQKSIGAYEGSKTTSKYYDILQTKMNQLKWPNETFLKGVKTFETLTHKLKEIQWMQNFYSKIMQWRTNRNIQQFISPIYERINNEQLFDKFRLNKNDARHIMYFLCLHTWMYSNRLNTIKNNYLKIMLWEKTWDYYRGLLMKFKISEFSFNTYLVNMQEYSLGFCVGMDECIDKDYYAGQIHHLLFNHIYNAEEDKKNSKELMELTIYSIRMFRFIHELPIQNFLEATFTWPDPI